MDLDYLGETECCDDCSYQEYLIHQQTLTEDLQDLEDILYEIEDPQARQAVLQKASRIRDELQEPYSRYDWDNSYRRIANEGNYLFNTRGIYI